MFVRCVSAAPRPGYEFQYYLAWKHRSEAAKLMDRYRLWPPGAYARCYALWKDAVDRTHRFGEDVVYSTVSAPQLKKEPDDVVT